MIYDEKLSRTRMGHLNIQWLELGGVETVKRQKVMLSLGKTGAKYHIGKWGKRFVFSWV